jgi:hypothetical protein
MREGFES